MKGVAQWRKVTISVNTGSSACFAGSAPGSPAEPRPTPSTSHAG